MAKVLIGTDYGSYTFNASLKQITFVFPNNTTAKLERVLLISNVVTNEIIYNFSNPSLGGSLTGNVLTLDFNTTSMINSDSLQIWYYNETDATVFDDNANAMRLLMQTQLSNMPVTDSTGRLRIFLDAANTGINLNTISTITTLSTVTTVATLSNITNIAGFNALLLFAYGSHSAVETQSQKIIVT